jgi:glycerate-2-kinase
VTVLAAGTDGRDGPTDAAGAIVDGTTWQRIRDAGLDPAAHLARHDAWHALDAAGALLRTGPTGTNVNDVVIATIA